MNSTCSYWSTVPEDVEEQRKIVEGADALLNLAGIKTPTQNAKKRAASSAVVGDEQRPRNAKQSCHEPFPGRPQVARRDRLSTDVGVRKSINFAEEPAACSDASNDDVSEVDDEPPYRVKPRSRAAAVKNRPPRKKLEKRSKL